MMMMMIMIFAIAHVHMYTKINGKNKKKREQIVKFNTNNVEHVTSVQLNFLQKLSHSDT